jgi:hypothetical protein
VTYVALLSMVMECEKKDWLLMRQIISLAVRLGHIEHQTGFFLDETLLSRFFPLRKNNPR